MDTYSPTDDCFRSFLIRLPLVEWAYMLAPVSATSPYENSVIQRPHLARELRISLRVVWLHNRPALPILALLSAVFQTSTFSSLFYFADVLSSFSSHDNVSFQFF